MPPHRSRLRRLLRRAEESRLRFSRVPDGRLLLRGRTRAASRGLGCATRSRRRRPLPVGPRAERTRQGRRSSSTWSQPSPRRGDVTAGGSSSVSTPSPPRSAGKGAEQQQFHLPPQRSLASSGSAMNQRERDLM